MYARVYPLFAILAVCTSHSPAAGQGRLVSAELAARLDAVEHVVTVHIRYKIQPHGKSEVPLAVVRFGEVALENVRANDVPITLVLDATGLRPTATVALPVQDTVSLNITYDVRIPEVEPRRIRIPIVAVLWPPQQAVAGAVVARVSLPSGTVPFDAFPSTLRRASDTESANTYTTELHVVPALITFSVASRAPWPSAITGIELMVCAGLVLVGIIGWRRFRVEMR